MVRKMSMASPFLWVVARRNPVPATRALSENKRITLGTRRTVAAQTGANSRAAVARARTIRTCTRTSRVAPTCRATPAAPAAVAAAAILRPTQAVHLVQHPAAAATHRAATVVVVLVKARTVVAPKVTATKRGTRRRSHEKMRELSGERRNFK